MSTETIQPLGHFSMHLWHCVHLFPSMTATFSSTLTASLSHAFSQSLHPIQDTSHTLRAVTPLSLFLHFTTTACPRLSTGTREISPLGQALTQEPHAVHICSLNSGNPVSGFMVTPPNWQWEAQSPHPRQP